LTPDNSLQTPDNSLGVLSSVEGIFSLASGISNASLQKELGRFQSSQLRIQAKFADLSAADAIERGDKEANQLRRRLRNLEGDQVLASAASGIDPFSGSAQNLRVGDQLLGDLDIIQIKTNAYREAFGFKTQSTSLIRQAEMAKLSAQRSANNTLIAGGLEAVNSGLLAGYYFNKSRTPEAPAVPGAPGVTSTTSLFDNNRNIFYLERG